MSETWEQKKERYQQMILQYGGVALAVWYTLFFIVLLPSAYLAWSEGGLSVWAALGAGWVAAQPTKLVRIPLFLVITPIVARWIGREPSDLDEAAEGGDGAL